MNERGWGWTKSEIRQARLVEWLVPAEDEIKVESFYADLPEWLANTDWVADADALRGRGVIDYSYRAGGLLAWATPQGQDWAESLQAMRSNGRQRRVACRDAMTAWLYSCDATDPHPARRQLRDAMLVEPRFGYWLAQPFSSEDLEEAAGWLERHEMVEGPGVEEIDGPLQLSLMDEGVECAENFDADTRRYIAANNTSSSSGPTVHIDTNHGPFQVAGDHAHQVQNIGASAEHLREMITSVAELVRQLVPNAQGIDAQQQVALNAAGDGAVDQSALRRFRTWVLSVVQRGATAALVPAVTSATDDMLREAARIASHLG